MAGLGKKAAKYLLTVAARIQNRPKKFPLFKFNLNNSCLIKNRGIDLRTI